MKVNNVTLNSVTNFTSKKQSRLPFRNSVQEDVYVSEKAPKKLGHKLRIAAGILAATQILLAPFGAGAANKPVQDYSALTVEDINTINLDNEFQLAQTLDAPSLTFDITENWMPHTIVPKNRTATINGEGENENKYHTIADIIEDNHGIDPLDSKNLYLAAYSVLKANPFLLDRILPGQVDFRNGDVTNVDPELILATDLSASNDKISIFLPDVTVLEETNEDNSSVFVG